MRAIFRTLDGLLAERDVTQGWGGPVPEVRFPVRQPVSLVASDDPIPLPRTLPVRRYVLERVANDVAYYREVP